jgi:hypothetical protein
LDEQEEAAVRASYLRFDAKGEIILQVVKADRQG